MQVRGEDARQYTCTEALLGAEGGLTGELEALVQLGGDHF